MKFKFKILLIHIACFFLRTGKKKNKLSKHSAYLTVHGFSLLDFQKLSVKWGEPYTTATSEENRYSTIKKRICGVEVTLFT
jgi:hypothetical protein